MLMISEFNFMTFYPHFATHVDFSFMSMYLIYKGNIIYFYRIHTFVFVFMVHAEWNQDCIRIYRNNSHSLE